jgi:Flp pilus assembly pilin Flp
VIATLIVAAIITATVLIDRWLDTHYESYDR